MGEHRRRLDIGIHLAKKTFEDYWQKKYTKEAEDKYTASIQDAIQVELEKLSVLARQELADLQSNLDSANEEIEVLTASPNGISESAAGPIPKKLAIN